MTDRNERNRLGDVDADRLMVLGQLAGGVAHDFNNQLTSIIGYADLLLEDLPEDAPSRADLLEIRRAAERAHLVTTHLLAFRRPRPAEPALVSVAATLMSHLHLLRRVLGEDIQIVTAFDREAIVGERDLVRADPSHLGHVLLCVGVDARQALPHGGTLTIEMHLANTAAATTTSHVRVTLTMTPTPDAPAIAEPTDPAPGRPVIDAIVREAGGDVRFDDNGRRDDNGGDAAGRARRVSIDLPHVERPAGHVDVHDLLPHGSEHVLIVEHDTAVRDVMRRSLERHGYTVRVADHPRQARATVGSPPVGQPAIDLAIVDVVLPDQRGDQLARELMTMRPGLRVLFVSGRGDEETASAAPGFCLRKPFSPNELLIAARQALDSTPPRREPHDARDAQKASSRRDRRDQR